MRNFSRNLILSVLAGSSLVAAQDLPNNAPAPAQQPAQPAPQNGGWRRFGDAPQNQDPNRSAPPAPSPSFAPNSTIPAAIPAHLTLKAGTYITVRVDDPLSSDRNQVGDAFSAGLVEPIVVDGVIVAQHGQTIGGRVAEAQKAGRVRGTSRLGLQLTDLTLVDGQVVPVKSELISRSGPTSTGRDAAVIGGSTAVGAAVGAGAAGGFGAAVGAGAGAAASTIGVLLTRGRQTIIGPESVLTFRVEEPIDISTERSSQAFRYVEPTDYNRPAGPQTRQQAPPPPAAPYGAPYAAPPPPPYYGYAGYGYAGYPYFGPGFGLYFGPGFYFGGGGFFGGRFWR